MVTTAMTEKHLFGVVAMRSAPPMSVVAAAGWSAALVRCRCPDPSVSLGDRRAPWPAWRCGTGRTAHAHAKSVREADRTGQCTRVVTADEQRIGLPGCPHPLGRVAVLDAYGAIGRRSYPHLRRRLPRGALASDRYAMTTRRRRTRPRTAGRVLLLLAFGVVALLPAATLPTASGMVGRAAWGATDRAAPAVDAVGVPPAVQDGFGPVERPPDVTPARSAPPRFEWPLPGRPDVGRPFSAPLAPFGPGHRGVDLMAPPGTPVRAAAEGVVVFAGTLAGRGVVSIDHQLLRTTYEPVKPAVRVGDQVYAGQRIGTLLRGHLGCDPACLHWGVRSGTAPPEYLNPLPLLVPTTVRLKPWPE